MRHFLLFFAIVLCFSACRDKVICPAFQSTYILDDSVRNIYYSYLWRLDEDERLKYLAQQKSKLDTSRSMANDSTAVGGPALASAGEVDYWAYVAKYKVPERDVRKNKFGIVKYEPYWLKNYRQRTAPMENVLTPPPAVLPEDTVSDVGEFVASDFSDSLAVADSITLASSDEQGVDGQSLMDEDSFHIPSLPPIAKETPPKDKTEVWFMYRYDPKDELHNVEQQYYNKYFGDQLYVKLIENKVPEDTTSVEEESKWGFLKNLFGKKKKAETDSLATEEPPAFDEQELLPQEDLPAEEEQEGDGNGF